METIIKITDSQAPLLILAVEQAQKDVEAKLSDAKSVVSDLEKQFADNNAILITLKQNIKSNGSTILRDSEYAIKNSPLTNGAKNVLSKSGYPLNGSWWEKITYFLKTEHKPLGFSEIFQLVYSYEPELKSSSQEVQDKAKGNIYATLSNKFKSEDLWREKGKNDKESKYSLIK